MDNKSLILRGPPQRGTISLDSTGFNLLESLKRNRNSSQPAIIDVSSGERLSYQELLEKSCKVAINLKKLGFAGKVIGICSENRCDFFIPLLAGLYLGSPVATINPAYTKREIIHAFSVVKPTFVFCSASIYDTVKKIRLSENLSFIQQIWTMKNLNGFIKGNQNIRNFQAVKVNVKEQVAQLLFSSGTTGLPKAVMITHYNLNAFHNIFRDTRHVLTEMKNFLTFLPFYHSYGLNVSLGCILMGYTVKFLPKFEENQFYQAIQDYKVSFLTLVPPLMVLLAKSPLVDKYDLSSVTKVILGGASCSKELGEAVSKRLNGLLVYQGYGMTETTFSVISNPNNSVPRDGTVGMVDPGCEIKIRDPESGRTLGPNEVGEICVKSPCVMKGYYGNPEASRASFTDDNWLLTGDMGYYDHDGYIRIVDRLKELIKYKGFQVPPAELEAILLTHSKINDAAVVGLPDELAGELPLAFVVKKPNVQLTEFEVIDFVKGQVSNAKQLRGGVRFVSAIPKIPSGKILRRQLREMLKQQSKL